MNRSSNTLVGAWGWLVLVWCVAICQAATAPPTVPPEITQQPQDQTVVVGGVTAFSVLVSGTAPFTFQWRMGGAAIGPSDQTNVFFLGKLTADAAGPYSVVVANSAGSVTSTVANLTVTARQVRLSSFDFYVTNTTERVVVTNELVALTNENQVSFSLVFDPAVLANPQAAVTVDVTDTNAVSLASPGGTPGLAGSGDAPSASVTTDGSQVAQGKFGVTVALPAGATFRPGPRSVATVTFDLNPGMSLGAARLRLGNEPVAMQTKDPAGNPMPLAAARLPVAPAAEVQPLPDAVSLATGLFTQVATVSNPGVSNFVSIRMLIRGLTNDLLGNPIRVFNATGTSNAIPYLEFGPVAAGEAFDVPIQFYVSDRDPASLAALGLVYELQAALAFRFPAIADLRLAAVRQFQTNGTSEATNVVMGLRFEFDAQRNSFYYVQGRVDWPDGSWQTISPALQGYGQRISWVLGGTDPVDLSSAGPRRFYRVMRFP